MKRTKEVLRWIAVLPGGLLAATAILFPMHWLILILEDESLIGLFDIPPEPLERGIAAVVVPATIIYAGAMIAPQHQFYSAIALAVLVAFGMGASLAFVAADPLRQFGAAWQTILTVVLWAVGVGAALYYVREAEHESLGR